MVTSDFHSLISHPLKLDAMHNGTQASLCQGSKDEEWGFPTASTTSPWECATEAGSLDPGKPSDDFTSG